MSNEIWMGGRAMMGEKLTDIASLSAQIKAQEKQMREQNKKRSKWTRWGKFAKTFFPGPGNILDFIIDRYAQDKYDLITEDELADIKGKETFWTSGQAEEYGEEFLKKEEDIDVDFGEALLSSVADYATSWAGQEMLSRIGVGSFMEKYKEKLPSWLSWGIPGADKVATPNVPTSIKLSKGAETAGDLPRLFNPKYYGGGIVQDGKIPTISEYFDMQGKTLGGSNKQSLAEMLGRK